MSTSAVPERPEPERTIDSNSYFASAARGQFELTRCRNCGAAFHYARPLCPRCGDWDVESFIASGRAVIHSFTVIYRAPSDAFRPDVPYVLAIVETEEGARLLSNIRNVDPDSVRIGQAVTVEFEPRADTAVPVFVPAEPAEATPTNTRSA